jgi:hypothetical protein
LSTIAEKIRFGSKNTWVKDVAGLVVAVAIFHGGDGRHTSIPLLFMVQETLRRTLVDRSGNL